MERRRFGSTDLRVSLLGVGGGYGIGPDALEFAFDQGINYFFWAPWLPTYRNMRRGLRRLIPGYRDELVISVEPGLLMEDGIYHVEENLIVTQNGCEVLSQAPRTLWTLV